MKTTKSIIITGTHHTPAIELIRLLRLDPTINWDIHYIAHQYSTETHIVHTIIPKLKIKFYNLIGGKFDRKNIDKTIFGIPKTLSAIFTASKLVSQLKPNIIVSFGGYISVPVIIAGFFHRIPSITHEQTLTMSLSTKINSLFATKVAVSFPHKNAVLTGNLIRSEIYKTNSVKFKKVKLPFIYITGGNQGSIFLNNLVAKLLPQLSKKFSVIHQTGKNVDLQLQSSLIKKYPNYHPQEFIEIEDIGWVLNFAHTVISRSGANICQEIDILNKNSILIPLPYSQQQEQIKNANWVQSRHPMHTIIIDQANASPDIIINSISPHNHHPKPTTINSTHPLFNLIHEISL